jgi:hypothetical protein
MRAGLQRVLAAQENLSAREAGRTVTPPTV